MIDWSLGAYERSAAALESVSDLVVARAAVGPGDRVLDIACGTGNAALKAAALGASVTGVDLAPRLVLVAKQRARTAGLDVSFLTGDARELPVRDASADVVLSVFGVVFVPDPAQVAAEIVRVLAPGGRALITAWVRTGALADTGAAIARAVGDGVGGRPTTDDGSGRMDWTDPAAVAACFDGHDVDLAMAEEEVVFTAESPDAWEADQAEHHPLWIAAREQLGDDRFRELDRRLVDILHDANEDPQGFRVTSRYVIATLTRRA